MHIIKLSSSFRGVPALRRFLLKNKQPSLISCLSTVTDCHGRSDEESSHFTNHWVQRFNKTAAMHPNVSVYFFLALRTTSWYILTAIYSQIWTFGPELAAGYLVTKFSGKFRQPANAMLAGAISSTFPSLQRINSSALVGVVPHPEGPAPSSSSAPKTHDVSPAFAATEERVQKFLDWLKGPLDKFGFSYFLASKVNIIATICGTAVAIEYGVDLTSILNALGVSQTIQSGAGAMAAATLTNIGLLPAHLFALTIYSPKISDIISKTSNTIAPGAPQDHLP